MNAQGFAEIEKKNKNKIILLPRPAIINEFKRVFVSLGAKSIIIIRLLRRLSSCRFGSLAVDLWIESVTVSLDIFNKEKTICFMPSNGKSI